MEDSEGPSDVVQAVEAALRAYKHFSYELAEPGEPEPTLIHIEQCCEESTVATVETWLRELVNRVKLAEAHDRQPYPTADAYERVCAARTAAEQKSEAARIDLAACRATTSELLDTIAKMHQREQQTRAREQQTRASKKSPYDVSGGPA